MEAISVLIVDDEPHCVDMLLSMMEEYDALALEPHPAYSPTEAISIASHGKIDIMITDLNMPGIGGIALIDEIRKLWPFCLVIILTAYPAFESAKDAISRNVFEYVTKMNMRAEMPSLISRAAETIYQREVQKITYSQKINRMNRHAFFYLLQSEHMPEKEKTSILNQLGFSLAENARFFLIQSTRQMPAEMVRSLLIANCGGNLLGCSAFEDEDGCSAAILQITQSIPDAWVGSVLETIQECLKANAFATSFLVFPMQDTDYFAAFGKLRQEYHRLSAENELYVHFIRSDEPLSSPNDSGYYDILVKRITEYIDANICNDVSLIHLADVFGYSRTYISGVFHKTKNESLQQYILRQRMSLIDAWMKNPDISFDEMSESIGFSSPSYFSRFIRRETGLSPKEYRIKIINET